MVYRLSIFFGILLLLPQVVFAASCSKDGYTVVYVNGILGTNESVKDDLKILKNILPPNLSNEQVIVDTATNPSKLGGVDDILKIMRQIQFWHGGAFHEDTDVDTILNEIYSELTTQKVLLVGHSQGAFYTNDIYYYLISHGISPRAVAVYNIASPADTVAGNGNYETSFNDQVIAAVRNDVLTKPYLFGTKLPLSANFIADTVPDDPTGHLFVPSYLNAEPDTIVGDIRRALSKLKPTYSTDIQEPCFNPPDHSLPEVLTISVKDHALSTAEGAYIVGVGSAYGVLSALYNVGELGGKILTDVGTTIGGVIGLSHAATPDKQPTDFAVFKALYGSSLDTEGVEDLLDQNQGAAAVLALVPPKQEEATGTVLGTSTEPQPPQQTEVPVTVGTILPIPEPPKPIPGEVVHYNAPAWDTGPQITESSSTEASSSEEASTTPFTSLSVQNISFSNWRSNNTTSVCDLTDRLVDVSWDSVPNAVSYEVYENSSDGDPAGNSLFATVPVSSVSNVSLSLGMNWNRNVLLSIRAVSAVGEYSATTTVSVNDMATDKVGPQIISFEPTLSSTDIPSTTPIRITYDETVDPTTLSVGLSHRIESPVAIRIESIETSAFLEGDGKTVDITPAEPLVPGDGYYFYASCSVKDLLGNPAQQTIPNIGNSAPDFRLAP